METVTANLSSRLDEHATAICIFQKMVLFTWETRDSRLIFELVCPSKGWQGYLSTGILGSRELEAETCHYSKNCIAFTQTTPFLFYQTSDSRVCLLASSSRISRAVL